MTHANRIAYERFIKTRQIEALFVEETVAKANHDRTEENKRIAEWAQRTFLSKYKHNWREFLPQQGREM